MAPELDRVRDDLQTIQAAIGLNRPAHKRELQIYLLLAGAGCAALAWAVAPHGQSPLWGYLAFIVPVIAWLRHAARGATDSNEIASARQEIHSAISTIWLCLPLVALHFWGREVGLTLVQSLGLMAFVIGMMLFSSAVGDRRQRALVVWGVALMAGGLAVSTSVLPPVAGLAGAIGAAGLASAAASAWKLQQEQSPYAAG